ncbi:hypothetical protein CAL20_21005 [Bordetella genomosp. 4]|uniref:Uncharacterized protein n=1 Tax=Bordetella genomosp. 4 TaxID=463044 RepID=A0A261TSK0_9BORD|nr:hypothetical protein CAL20_21005 [Bordetella genomosp. 4]
MQKGLDTRFCVFIAAAQYFFDETQVFIDEMRRTVQRNNMANSFFDSWDVLCLRQSTSRQS